MSSTASRESSLQLIQQFVFALRDHYGKRFHSIKLYARLIGAASPENPRHEDAITKHLNLFTQLCLSNGAAIVGRDKAALENARVAYSDKVYIDLPNVLNAASEAEAATIWTHLLAINVSLVPDDGDALRALRASLNNGASVNSLLGQAKEIYACYVGDSEENPMEKVEAMIASGGLQRAQQEVVDGFKNGSIDLGHLAKTGYDIMVGDELQDFLRSTPGIGEMISYVMDNMDGVQICTNFLATFLNEAEIAIFQRGVGELWAEVKLLLASGSMGMGDVRSLFVRLRDEQTEFKEVCKELAQRVQRDAIDGVLVDEVQCMVDDLGKEHAFIGELMGGDSITDLVESLQEMDFQIPEGVVESIGDIGRKFGVVVPDNVQDLQGEQTVGELMSKFNVKAPNFHVFGRLVELDDEARVVAERVRDFCKSGMDAGGNFEDTLRLAVAEVPEEQEELHAIRRQLEFACENARARARLQEWLHENL